MPLALSRWLSARTRKAPLRRAAHARLTVSRFEEKAVPAAMYAVGSGAGTEAVVNVYDENAALVTAIIPYAGFTGGVNVAMADLNADGDFDAVITAPGAGGGPHIKVWDIATGRVLNEFSAYAPNFTGGVFIATGDLDGDGVSDIVTGAGQGGGPHVKAFTALTSAELLSFNAYDPSFTGGVRVGTGDFGGDGTTDEIVTGPGVGGGAHIRLWDYDAQLNDPDNFANIDPNDVFPGFTGGVYVTGGNFTNNLDSEGFQYDDVVVSAGQGGGPEVKTFRLDAFVDAAARDVAVYIPANQVVAGDPTTVNPNYAGTDFNAYDPAFRGGARVAAVPDLNGDGLNEFLTGPGVGGGPDVRVLSGADITQLFRFSAFDPAQRLGIFVG